MVRGYFGSREEHSHFPFSVTFSPPRLLSLLSYLRIFFVVFFLATALCYHCYHCTLFSSGQRLSAVDRLTAATATTTRKAWLLCADSKVVRRWCINCFMAPGRVRVRAGPGLELHITGALWPHYSSACRPRETRAVGEAEYYCP